MDWTWKETTIMLCAFSGGALFIMLIVLLFWTLARRTKVQKKFKNMILELESSEINNEENQNALMSRLPAWKSNLSIDSCRWLNIIFSYVLSHFSEAIQAETDKNIHEIFSKLKIFKDGSLVLKNLHIGKIPPKIMGIYVMEQHCNSSEFVLGLVANYEGDAHVAFQWLCIPVEVNKFTVKVHLRVSFEIRPNRLPPIETVTISFMERPQVDYNFSGFLRLIDVSFVRSKLRTMVVDEMVKRMLFPMGKTITLNSKGVSKALLRSFRNKYSEESIRVLGSSFAAEPHTNREFYGTLTVGKLSHKITSRDKTTLVLVHTDRDDLAHIKVWESINFSFDPVMIQECLSLKDLYNEHKLPAFFYGRIHSPAVSVHLEWLECVKYQPSTINMLPNSILVFEIFLHSISEFMVADITEGPPQLKLKISDLNDEIIISRCPLINGSVSINQKFCVVQELQAVQDYNLTFELSTSRNLKGKLVWAKETHNLLNIVDGVDESQPLNSETNVPLGKYTLILRIQEVRATQTVSSSLTVNRTLYVPIVHGVSNVLTSPKPLKWHTDEFFSQNHAHRLPIYFVGVGVINAEFSESADFEKVVMTHVEVIFSHSHSTNTVQHEKMLRWDEHFIEIADQPALGENCIVQAVNTVYGQEYIAGKIIIPWAKELKAHPRGLVKYFSVNDEISTLEKIQLELTMTPLKVLLKTQWIDLLENQDLAQHLNYCFFIKGVLANDATKLDKLYGLEFNLSTNDQERTVSTFADPTSNQNGWVAFDKWVYVPACPQSVYTEMTITLLRVNSRKPIATTKVSVRPSLPHSKDPLDAVVEDVSPLEGAEETDDIFFKKHVEPLCRDGKLIGSVFFFYGIFQL